MYLLLPGQTLLAVSTSLGLCRFVASFVSQHGGVVFRFGSPFVSEVPVFFSASFASFGLSLRFVSFWWWWPVVYGLLVIVINFCQFCSLFLFELVSWSAYWCPFSLGVFLLLASSWQGHRFFGSLFASQICLFACLLVVGVGGLTWENLALMCILIACLFTITCVLLLCCCLR